MPTNPNLLEPLGRFRSDLVVEPQKKDGAAGAYRVLDPISNVSHVLTELEYAVATCMNGERNAMDVAMHAARLGHPVQADHVERFHRELEGLSFVYRDQPPTLSGPVDTSHRDDAKRFVEEAKRELALGRIEVARDLLDAALAIDRVAATNAATPATPTAKAKAATPALTGDALGPVLDYLKDWNVAPQPAPQPAANTSPSASNSADGAIPLPGSKKAVEKQNEMPVELPPLASESPAPQTGATARWTPPTFEALAPIDINIDEAGPPVPLVAANDVTGNATVATPARSSRRGLRMAAAAAVLVLLVAGVGATLDLTTLPTGALAFPEALASTPTDVAPADVAPVEPVAPVAPVAPMAPSAPVASSAPVAAVLPADAVPTDNAALPDDDTPTAKSSDTDVVAPAKGKFTRALVASGLKVKAGQRIAMLTAPNGKQTVITAPAAGIFEATLALGKTVNKGDVVGVVHAW